MIEFLRKFENLGIKIAWVNSILINLTLFFTLIFKGVGVRSDRRLSPFIVKSMIECMNGFTVNCNEYIQNTVNFVCNHNGSLNVFNKIKNRNNIISVNLHHFGHETLILEVTKNNYFSEAKNILAKNWKTNSLLIF